MAARWLLGVFWIFCRTGRGLTVLKRCVSILEVFQIAVLRAMREFGFSSHPSGMPPDHTVQIALQWTGLLADRKTGHTG